MGMISFIMPLAVMSLRGNHVMMDMSIHVKRITHWVPKVYIVGKCWAKCMGRTVSERAGQWETEAVTIISNIRSMWDEPGAV